MVAAKRKARLREEVRSIRGPEGVSAGEGVNGGVELVRGLWKDDILSDNEIE